MEQSIKIGVALGSGAAKGWAHIGVLRGLERLGIKPTLVAGCSIGAVVGAAYAAGKLDHLQKWVVDFSSWDVFSLLDLSWRKGGIIEGERVFAEACNAIGVATVAELPLPFMAVATDLYSGKEVWLEQGRLEDVLGASCAIPGLIMPKKLGNRWLVDGAVVNPVPVSACRAMGADMVIAVDLHSDVRPQVEEPQRIDTEQAKLATTSGSDAVAAAENSNSAFIDLFSSGKQWVDRISSSFSSDDNRPNAVAVMHQSMEILEQRHKRARMMGDPPEAIVLPQVGDIVTMEFHRAAEAIAEGEAAVERVAHLLEAEMARLQQARQQR